MTSLGIVVQARMGSTRLPGKVLLPVGHLPLLGHVIGRLAQLPQCWPVVVATSTNEKDNAIVEWCKQNRVTTFRGSELDVLDRYVECAQTYGFTQVVRLTADNPFTDITELDRLVKHHLSGGFDYSHSFGMMPLGVGAEILSLVALERSHAEGLEPHHREHVNEYIHENPELFRIGVLDVPLYKHAFSLRLTVDTEEDLRLANTLTRRSEDHWLHTREAIRLCSSFA